MKKLSVVLLVVLSLLFLTSCKKTKFDDHYIVVYYLGNQANMESAKVPKGEKLSRPVDPVSEESEFDDWYSDIDYTTPFDFSKPITESITIFGKWTYVEYNINYELGEATNDPLNPLIYTLKLGTFRLRSPILEGYRFISWHTKSDFSDPQVISLTKDNVTDGMTLYPRWRKLVI